MEESLLCTCCLCFYKLKIGLFISFTSICTKKRYYRFRTNENLVGLYIKYIKDELEVLGHSSIKQG